MKDVSSFTITLVQFTPRGHHPAEFCAGFMLFCMNSSAGVLSLTKSLSIGMSQGRVREVLLLLARYT